MDKFQVRHLYGEPKVGGDTLAYCSRCKIELAHIIASMMDGRPAKVICKTCKAQHKYKRVGDIALRATRTSGSSRTRSTPSVVMKMSELWEKRVSESKKADPKSYQVKESYAKGELIQHPKFGLGVVEEVQSSKINVLFRDAERVLVHALK